MFNIVQGIQFSGLIFGHVKCSKSYELCEDLYYNNLISRLSVFTFWCCSHSEYCSLMAVSVRENLHRPIWKQKEEVSFICQPIQDRITNTSSASVLLSFHRRVISDDSRALSSLQLPHLHRPLINGKAATLDSQQFFAGERYDEMKTVFIALSKWRG